MHDSKKPRSFTAFQRGKIIVAGLLPDVVSTAQGHLENPAAGEALIFDDSTGEQIDVDLRGPLSKILKHLPALDGYPTDAPAPARPGRPKLGVVAREVTLMPRHWEWLGSQPGGASVTIRKIVEQAIRATKPGDRIRHARESCYRFIMAAAGDRPGFEDATRALFAGDLARFEKATAPWPRDIQDYAKMLSASAFPKAA